MATATDFPPGMTTCKVSIHISGPTGRYASGHIRVLAERKFGYAGSPWVMQEVSPWTPTKLGDAMVEMPHTNQANLIGDNGVTLTTEPAYQIVFRPLNSSVIQTQKWIHLPTSFGAAKNLSEIADLGGWPNATIIFTPNPTGSVSNVVYVPDTDPADVGLVTVTDNGSIS